MRWGVHGWLRLPWRGWQWQHRRRWFRPCQQRVPVCCCLRYAFHLCHGTWAVEPGLGRVAIVGCSATAVGAAACCASCCWRGHCQCGQSQQDPSLVTQPQRCKRGGSFRADASGRGDGPVSASRVWRVPCHGVGQRRARGQSDERRCCSGHRQRRVGCVADAAAARLCGAASCAGTECQAGTGWWTATGGCRAWCWVPAAHFFELAEPRQPTSAASGFQIQHIACRVAREGVSLCSARRSQDCAVTRRVWRFAGVSCCCRARDRCVF